MSESIEALKPCPFCGGPGEIDLRHDPTRVGCFNPDCGVRPKVASSHDHVAITRWNCRPSPALADNDLDQAPDL